MTPGEIHSERFELASLGDGDPSATSPSENDANQSHLESWGPPTERHQVRVMRVCELVAAHLGLSVDAAAELVMSETQGAHRYLLLRELGRSSHAVVYLAVDQLLTREVALKIHLAAFERSMERNALREARTQVLFEHDNVVRLFDAGECEGRYYWVTELCDEDLGSWSRGKPWAVVLRRVLEAGRGLEALHAMDIVHGDVKPQNIMVRRGVAKIGDFGMSGRSDACIHVGGTQGYIAPELARSPAADVFALSCTAWTCVFGQLPHEQPAGGDRETSLLLSLERARSGVVLTPPNPQRIPARIIDVLREGLAPAPTARPLLNEWLSELEWCVNVRTRRYRLRFVGWAAGASGLLITGGVLHALYARAPQYSTTQASTKDLPDSTTLTAATSSGSGDAKSDAEQAIDDSDAGSDVVKDDDDVEPDALTSTEGEDTDPDAQAWSELSETLEEGLVTPAEQLEFVREMVEEAESTSSIKKIQQAKLALGSLRVISRTQDEKFRQEVAKLKKQLGELHEQPLPGQP